MRRSVKIFLFATLGLVLSVVITIEFIVKPFVKSEIDTFLAGNTSRIYDYSYESLGLSFLNGQLAIKNVKVDPKAAALDSVRQGYFEDIDRSAIERISINVNYLAYLQERKVEFEDITLINPEIEIYYHARDTVSQHDPLVLTEIFNDNFQGITFDNFKVQNADIKFTNIETDVTELELVSINILFNELVINQETLGNRPLGMDFKDFEVSLGSLNFKLNDYYNLDIGELDFDLDKSDKDNILAHLVVSNVAYQPTELAFSKLNNDRLRALSLIKADKIEITGFEPEEFILDQQIKFAAIEVTAPEIVQHVNSDMERSHQRDPVRFARAKIVKEVKGGRILVKDGKTTLKDIHETTPDMILAGVEFDFEDITINDETSENTAFGLLYEQGYFGCSGISKSMGEHYDFTTGKIAFDIDQEEIIIQNVHFAPNFTKEEMPEVLEFETDRFDVKVGQVQVRNVDLERISDLNFVVDALVLKDLQLDVYRNKWMDDPEFKYKPLLGRTIHNVKFPFVVGEIKVENANIVYEQLGDLIEYEDEKPGHIEFANLNATGYRLTNREDLLANNPEFVLDAECKFMGKADMTAQYKFFIPDTTGRFYVKGGLSDMPTKELGPILRNMILAEIPDGHIHSFTFDMKGNDNGMAGTVDMEYENLKVNLLRVKDTDKSSGFWNTMSNTVVKRNNLKTKGKYVRGIVNEERKKNKSIFNFTWAGLKSGIISTTVPFVKSERVRKRDRE